MKVEAGAAQTAPERPPARPQRKADFEKLLRETRTARMQRQAQAQAARRGPAGRAAAGDEGGGGELESFETRAARRAFAFAELGMLEAGRATAEPGAGRVSTTAPDRALRAGEAPATTAMSGTEVPHEALARLAAALDRTSGPGRGDGQMRPAAAPTLVESGLAMPALTTASADSDLEGACEAAAEAGEAPGQPAGATVDGPQLALHVADGLAQLIVRADHLSDVERQTLRRRLEALLAEHGLGLDDFVLNGEVLDLAPSGVRHGHRSD